MGFTKIFSCCVRGCSGFKSPPSPSCSLWVTVRVFFWWVGKWVWLWLCLNPGFIVRVGHVDEDLDPRRPIFFRACFFVPWR